MRSYDHDKAVGYGLTAESKMLSGISENFICLQHTSKLLLNPHIDTFKDSWRWHEPLQSGHVSQKHSTGGFSLNMEE